MKIFRPPSTTEKIIKFTEELQTAEGGNSEDEEARPTGQHIQGGRVIKSQVRLLEMMHGDARSRYFLAESLVLEKISREFRSPPRREMSLQNKYGHYLFDAVFDVDDGFVAVEIKVLSDRSHVARMHETLKRIETAIAALPENIKRNARVILAIAYDMPEDRATKIKNELASMLLDSQLPIQVRMYDLKQLIAESGIK